MSQWDAWKSVSRKVAKPQIDFSGRWINPLGSEMVLVVTGNAVSGKYTTAVGAPKPSEHFDLTGVINGDLISFNVSWGDYGSITSWVGEYAVDSGKEKIVAMWHLVKNVDDASGSKDLWGAFLNGSNTFERAPTPTGQRTTG